MKRHPVLIPLSHDHRHSLFLAQVIKHGESRFPDVPTTPEAKRAYALREYERLLRGHFRVEEELLAPMVRGRDSEIDLLLDIVVQEHREIATLVESLHTPGPLPDLEERLHTLGVRLEQHIRMEERQLFQRIQAVADDDIMMNLGVALAGYQQTACSYDATLPPE